MGDFEARTLVLVESSVKYHFCYARLLIPVCVTRKTVRAGQFNWGGSLPKSNGGAQWQPQRGRLSRIERKGIRLLDCETY